MARTPIHPGEILADELDELGVSPTELSRQIRVPANRISQIINGKRAITGDFALRLAVRRPAMRISADDVVPLSQARANFSELAADVRAGAGKIITKNGESSVALIGAQRLDHHRLERARIHLLLIDEAGKGLDDVAAGRVKDARGAIQSIKRRRCR